MLKRKPLFISLLVLLAFLFSAFCIGCGEQPASTTDKSIDSEQANVIQNSDEDDDEDIFEEPKAPPKETPQESKVQEPPKTSTPSVDPQPSKKEVTVYVTKTGKKYHTAGCKYLSKSQIPMSLSDAKSSGYTPCSVCNPPR